MYAYQSKDGLAQSNDLNLINAWNAIEVHQHQEEANWINKLRKEGIKAAHPDDGWINRTENSIQFVYAQFNDRPQIGDRIALGWQWKYRVVTITDIKTRRGIFIQDYLVYYFQEED